MWERGLKHPICQQINSCLIVAPHVGAWVKSLSWAMVYFLLLLVVEGGDVVSSYYVVIE